MSLLRIFLTQNQIVNQVNIFFSAGSGPPLSVSLLTAPVSRSELFQQPVNATFLSCICLNLFVNSNASYPFN